MRAERQAAWSPSSRLTHTYPSAQLFPADISTIAYGLGLFPFHTRRGHPSALTHLGIGTTSIRTLYVHQVSRIPAASGHDEMTLQGVGLGP